MQNRVRSQALDRLWGCCWIAGPPFSFVRIRVQTRGNVLKSPPFHIHGCTHQRTSYTLSLPIAPVHLYVEGENVRVPQLSPAFPCQATCACPCETITRWPFHQRAGFANLSWDVRLLKIELVLPPNYFKVKTISTISHSMQSRAITRNSSHVTFFVESVARRNYRLHRRRNTSFATRVVS